MTRGDFEKLKELLRQIAPEMPAEDHEKDKADQSGPNEEVVLDFDIDGSRYLLIRLRHPPLTTAQLSPREQEIVRLVALGHSNKIIADVLSISSWTVCTHVRRIFSKLGVVSRAAMVARAAAMQRLQTTRPHLDSSNPPSSEATTQQLPAGVPVQERRPVANRFS